LTNYKKLKKNNLKFKIKRKRKMKTGDLKHEYNTVVPILFVEMVKIFKP